jgi:hypothetical protein
MCGFLTRHNLSSSASPVPDVVFTVFATVVRSMTPYDNMVHYDTTGDMARMCSKLIHSHMRI